MMENADSAAKLQIQSREIPTRVISSVVRLANSDEGSLVEKEVERELSISLSALRSLDDGSVTFGGDLPANGGGVEFFVDGANVVLSILPRGQSWLGDGCYNADDLAAALRAAGWTDGGTITHPFVQQSFDRGPRSLRVQRAGACVIKIELLSSAR